MDGREGEFVMTRHTLFLGHALGPPWEWGLAAAWWVG
jgi:hypothetical protein